MKFPLWMQQTIVLLCNVGFVYWAWKDWDWPLALLLLYGWWSSINILRFFRFRNKGFNWLRGQHFASVRHLTVGERERFDIMEWRSGKLQGIHFFVTVKQDVVEVVFANVNEKNGWSDGKLGKWNDGSVGKAVGWVLHHLKESEHEAIREKAMLYKYPVHVMPEWY